MILQTPPAQQGTLNKLALRSFFTSSSLLLSTMNIKQWLEGGGMPLNHRNVSIWKITLD